MRRCRIAESGHCCVDLNQIHFQQLAFALTHKMSYEAWIKSEMKSTSRVHLPTFIGKPFGDPLTKTFDLFHFWVRDYDIDVVAFWFASTVS
jgi:hypothetical protein